MIAKELQEWYSICSKNYGSRTAVKIWRDLFFHTKHLLAGKAYTKGPLTLGGVWIRARKNGIPVVLPRTSKAFDNNPYCTMCVVGLVTLISLPPQIDLKPIISRYTGTWSIDHGLDYWAQQVLKSLRNPVPESVVFTPYFTMKAGPNHRLALLGTLADALALFAHYEFENFSHWCDKLGAGDLSARALSLLCHTPLVDYQKIKHLSLKMARLVAISDKAGKSRTVYVANIWVQTLMKPLHDHLMKWLKQQPQDGTYHTRQTIEMVREWTSLGKPIWSFDLRSATDRWPREHQYLVLKEIVGDAWADCWLWAVEIPAHIPRSATTVTYAVGQPMGLLSSWAVFSVVHHVVLRQLCLMVGVKPDVYAILGDDLVIQNPYVAEKYLEFTSYLGVDISHSKSITPDTLSQGISSAEFAKRILKDGKELTPIPSNLCVKALDKGGHPGSLLELFATLELHVGHGSLWKHDQPNLLLAPPAAKLLTFCKTKVQNMVADSLSLNNAVPALGPTRFAESRQKDAFASYPSYANWCAYPDATSGFATHEILMIYLEAIESELPNLYAKLKNLDESVLQTGLPANVVPGFALASPAHFWRAYVAGIHDVMKDIVYTISHGTPLMDVNSYLIDANQMLDVIYGRDPHKRWLSNKDQIQDLKASRVSDMLKRLASTRLERESMTDQSYDDWY